MAKNKSGGRSAYILLYVLAILFVVIGLTTSDKIFGVRLYDTWPFVVAGVLAVIAIIVHINVESDKDGKNS